MTTMITGATGMIGNNVLRLLLARGEKVRVLIRPTTDIRPLAGLDVEHFLGDVRNVDDVRRAMRGVTRVVHSAAHLHIGLTQLEYSREVNVTGTRNVAEAALDESARMLHVSTVDTLGVGQPDKIANEEVQYGEKVNCSYVISKREAEAEVNRLSDDGLDAVIVHPTFTLGPNDWKPSSGRLLQTIGRHFTPITPRGGHTVGDARDVAAGILLALKSGERGRHYILGGHTISYFDFWKLCAHVTGTYPPIMRIGPMQRWSALSYSAFMTNVVGREPVVNSASMRMTDQFHYYSSERAQTELGYTIRPLRETVQDAWEWLKNLPPKVTTEPARKAG